MRQRRLRIARSDVKQVLAALDMALDALEMVDQAMRHQNGEIPKSTVIGFKAADEVRYALVYFAHEHFDAYERLSAALGLSGGAADTQ